MERIGRLENEDERNFYLFYAKAFASILESSYVTYPVFLEAVNRMADEIYTLMRTNAYDSIQFILTGEVEKSNLWIALLCMDYWDKKLDFTPLIDKINMLS